MDEYTQEVVRKESVRIKTNIDALTGAWIIPTLNDFWRQNKNGLESLGLTYQDMPLILDSIIEQCVVLKERYSKSKK